jgi:hypothetical protein
MSTIFLCDNCYISQQLEERQDNGLSEETRIPWQKSDIRAMLVNLKHLTVSWRGTMVGLRLRIVSSQQALVMLQFVTLSRIWHEPELDEGPYWGHVIRVFRAILIKYTHVKWATGLVPSACQIVHHLLTMSALEAGNTLSNALVR